MEFTRLFRAPRGRDWLRSLVKLVGGTIDHVDPRDQAYHGTLVVQPDGTFLVRLSCYSSPLRDNFTLAHALGHYVLHCTRKHTEPQVFYCNRCSDADADRFALLLLIPEFDESWTDEKLSSKYDLPIDVIRLRRQIKE